MNPDNDLLLNEMNYKSKMTEIFTVWQCNDNCPNRLVISTVIYQLNPPKRSTQGLLDHLIKYYRQTKVQTIDPTNKTLYQSTKLIMMGII